MRTDVNSSETAKKAPRGLMLTKLALGTALTLSLSGFAWAMPAAAQDDEIVLSGGGATLTVSPGHASAEATIASAEAGPGWAVTEAAAARAMAHADCGAMTEGAAASAVAMPDIGAEVEAAIAKAKATAQETAAGIDVESADLKEEFEECFEKERKVEPPKEKEEEVVYDEPEYEEVVVEEVPATGAGAAQAGLAGLMGAAAAAAALGAVALRRREDAAATVNVRY
ncbi:MAG: hypothetical protein KC442_03025 [Thermomicrobiales bacterium]|nr:hypothetical protein [Thermomicrobiales bacterium]